MSKFSECNSMCTMKATVNNHNVKKFFQNENFACLLNCEVIYVQFSYAQYRTYGLLSYCKIWSTLYNIWIRKYKVEDSNMHVNLTTLISVESSPIVLCKIICERRASRLV